MPGAVLRVGFTAPNFPERQSFFLGQLADVRFYQRRLSDQEVQSLQDGGGPDQGLRARWPLAEQRNGAVADATGHGHDGAVIRGEAAAVPSRLLVAGVEGLQSAPQWVTTDQGQLRLQIPAGKRNAEIPLVVCRCRVGGGRRNRCGRRERPGRRSRTWSR